MMPQIKVGEVTHYFTNISVAVLDLNEPLAVGDSIRIVGNQTDFWQTVESMQVEHEDVGEGLPGQEVAIKVTERVRPGDVVFREEE